MMQGMTTAAASSHEPIPSDGGRPLEQRRVVLLRHGQTPWAAEGRHTGRTEIPLTELGEQQSAAAGTVIAQLGLVDPAVIASPRLRARETARLAGFTAVREWDALGEWDYGNYEGLTTGQIRDTVPEWTVWTHPVPGGETPEAVQARADLVFSAVEPQLAEHDVVLVGHAHFSRALVARWLELPVAEGRRFAMAPAAVSVLGYEHGARQLVEHNLTEHTREIVV